MEYTPSRFKEVVSEFGEVFFVLESEREYEVHGTGSYELKNTDSLAGQPYVRVEGMQGDEWVIVEFGLDAIEHHYSHREV